MPLIEDGQVELWRASDGAFAPGDVGEISGNLALAQFDSATGASGASFWRGDGVWAVPTAGDVDGLADPTSNGIVVRTASNTTVARSLTQPADGLTISNNDGVSGNPTFALANDLAALEALSTTGFAKRTGTDTWTVAALVAGDIPDLSATYQPLNAKLTAIGALTSAAGLLRNNGSGVFSYDTSTYLTANQTITLSGDVSGSGATAITTTIGASKVTNAMLAGSIAFSKLLGTDRTLTAGAGLTGGGDLSADRTFTVGAGNGITVNADDVALTTPGTLTVSTTNSASGSHTHAVTSSSNPGAAASILATDSSGYLTTVRHTVTDYLFVNNSTANLFLKDTSTGFTSSASTIVTPITGNTISTTSFSSGLLGWRLYDTGNAEFANVDVRGAIRSSVLLYNAVLATNGSQIVVKSAAKLKADVTIGASPTYGSTLATIDVIDQDGLSHAASQLFVVGDIIRLKDGLAGDTWFTTTAVSDQTTFWRYTAVIQAGSNNVTYRSGLGVLDYGASGTGFIVQTADQMNSPYLQMATHNAAFTVGSSAGTLTVFPQLRIGNLNAFFASYASDVYGIAAGQQASGKSWFSLDPTNGFRIGNNTTTSVQIDASGNATFAGAITSTSGTIGGFSLGADYVRDAANSFGLASTVTGGDDVRFWAGDTFANRATAPFRVTEAGVATMTSGLVGGWTINSAAIQNSGGTVKLRGVGNLAFGSTPPTSASAGTGLYVDSTGLYGLLSNVVQAQFDATTGAITAGAGGVKLDVSGLRIATNVVGFSFFTGSEILGQINNTTVSDSPSSASYSQTLFRSQGSTAFPNSITILSAYNNTAGKQVNLTLSAQDVTGLYPAGYYAQINAAGGATLAGLTVGGTTSTVPTAMLDVRGTAAITDNLFLSSGKKIDWNAGDVTITHSSDTLTFAGAASGYLFSPGATGAIKVGDTTNGGWLQSGYGVVGAESGNYGQVGSNWYIGSGVSKLAVADYANRMFMDAGKFTFQNDNANGGGSANGTITWTTLVTINQNGGVVVGSPTGGNKGAGTINATAVYDDNVLLTDWLFDLHYDGKVKPDDHHYRGQSLFSLDTTRLLTETERRLPWMPLRETFETDRNLGGMVSRLWQGQEQQQLYIFGLEDRIKSLEAKVADLGTRHFE